MAARIHFLAMLLSLLALFTAIDAGKYTLTTTCFYKYEYSTKTITINKTQCFK
jgi:hypothetical protein